MILAISSDVVLPEPEDEAERKAVGDIRRFGWHCMLVRAVEGEDPDTKWSDDPRVQAANEATFSYTLGLTQTFGHPELILVGAWGSAQAILNTAAQLVAEGQRLQGGAISDEVLEGYPVRFDHVGEQCQRDLLTWAVWANFGRTVDALQLVLPDREGRWPEQDGYDAYPQPSLDG